MVPYALPALAQGTLDLILEPGEGLLVPVAAGGVIRIMGPAEQIEVAAPMPIWLRLRGSVAAAARLAAEGLDPPHQVVVQGQTGPESRSGRWFRARTDMTMEKHEVVLGGGLGR